MTKSKLDDFFKGWVVGNFNPTLHTTDQLEVAVKKYKTGEYEKRHYHKMAKEWTIIITGKVEMNGNAFTAGDIVYIEPNESTDFLALENTTTVVIKSPSVPNDKFEV
jgi:quercetin dioxygenase-like cupin family protein